MKSDWALLCHMRDYIGEIEEYLGGNTLKNSGGMARDAVLRKLQMIAQASIQLSEELKARHPDAQWHQLKAFRNVLVHEYFAIDLAEVDAALTDSFQVLKHVILVEIERSEEHSSNNRCD